MVQILQMAWVVEAVCKVHCEAVKSQKKDGGLPVCSRLLWKVQAESDREAGNRRHLGLS